jgi:putative transport protein
MFDTHPLRTTLLSLLDESPIFLFAVVASLGSLLGGVSVRGFSLGVAAVLFVGLFVSAAVPGAQLPADLQSFGLVLFVYSIGVSSASGFFAAIRREGVRYASIALLSVLVGGAICVIYMRRGMVPATAAGLFAGGLTNTPALAEVVEYLRDKLGPGASQLSLPIVAYSVAYPAGVLGAIVAVHVALGGGSAGGNAPRRSILSAAAVVRRQAITGVAIGELLRRFGGRVAVGRVRVDGVDRVPKEADTLQPGALVTLVGFPDDVEEAVKLLGERADENIALDRADVDFRRIVVSNRALVGVPLGELRLPETIGARITRLRRGDVELVPNATTRLEPGDRVRVVAPRDKMKTVTKHFGDSVHILSEVDMLTFGIGIGLGILLGNVTFPLPFGLSFRLGLAGGPLLTGLIAGALVRTGPLVWALPGAANLTLRQFGLTLFFATVGTRAGGEFARLIQTREGLVLAGSGVALTVVVAVVTVLFGKHALGIPPASLAGVVAAVHTQPAALAYANSRSQDPAVGIAYATAFPIATVVKIVAASLLAHG